MRGCRVVHAPMSPTPERSSTGPAVLIKPNPRTHPERGRPPSGTALTLSRACCRQPATAQRCPRKVVVSMVDSIPRLTDSPVDRLGAVREWLWRHSSQPNGDPWDGDPEHLDWAAQNLLNDLAQQLIGSSGPTSSPAPRRRTPNVPGIAATLIPSLPPRSPARPLGGVRRPSKTLADKVGKGCRSVATKQWLFSRPGRCPGLSWAFAGDRVRQASERWPFGLKR